MSGLSDILKGSTGALDTTLSGALTPEQAHNFIDTIKDKSDFLKKINFVKMGRLTKELDAWDMAKGMLVRVPSGQKPSEEQRKKLGVIGAKLDAKSVQLFARILQDALEENKHNSKFEEETFNAFATAFGNDLAYLGFAGTSDTYDGNFETLHKGWIQIAKDSSDTNKIKYDVSSDVTTRLKTLVKSINEDALANSVILINSEDLTEYNYELSKLNSATHLIEAGGSKILGVPLVAVNWMKKGEYLATPLKNLVIGTVLDIRRGRTYEMEERALKYVFEVYVDYEIVIKKWVSFMDKA